MENFENVFTKAIAAFAIVSVICITVYNVTNNEHWYNSWNKCVEAGGQPGNQSIPGVDSAQFTCVRK